jgi:hypothetical protein
LGFLVQGVRAGVLAGQASGHHRNECPVQVSFGVLGQAFVVADVAAGVHDPVKCPLDLLTAGQDDEALGALRPGEDAQGDPEAFAGPVHQPTARDTNHSSVAVSTLKGACPSPELPLWQLREDRILDEARLSADPSA